MTSPIAPKSLRCLIKKYSCPVQEETCPCPNDYVFTVSDLNSIMQYICDIGYYYIVEGTLSYNGNAGTFRVYVDQNGILIGEPQAPSNWSGNKIRFGFVDMNIISGTLIGNELSITVCADLDDFFANNPFPLTLNVKECYTSSNLSGATVTLTHVATLQVFSGTTNGSGNFSFNGPIGQYNVTVSATDYISDTFTVIYTTVDTLEEVCLMQLNNKTINIKNCQHLVNIPGATVTATHVATGTIYTGNTDASGNFTFTNAPDGLYNINVTNPYGYATLNTTNTFNNNTTSGVTLNLQICPATPGGFNIQCNGLLTNTYGFVVEYVSGPTNFGIVPAQGSFSQISLWFLIPGTYVVDVYSTIYTLVPVETYTIIVTPGGNTNVTSPCPEFNPFPSLGFFCDTYGGTHTISYVSGPTFFSTFVGGYLWNGSGPQPAFGTYTVSVSRTGYITEQFTFDYTYVTPDFETLIDVCLEPDNTPGALAIRCLTAAEADEYTVTYISGPTSFSPVSGFPAFGDISVSSLLPGSYSVSVSCPGFGTQTVSITVTPGGNTITTLCLEPEPEPEPIPGCMDPAATNYNPLATVDDGSCLYDEER